MRQIRAGNHDHNKIVSLVQFGAICVGGEQGPSNYERCTFVSSQNIAMTMQFRWCQQRGILTLPFGHLPNTFCFISPSICFISPSNLLRFPKKMLYFPNSLLHFPNKMLHFPNSLLHFPMQCCVTLPKNILPNILSFFLYFWH